MQFSVTFRQMGPSDALKSHAYEKLQHLQKFLPDVIKANVVLEVERRGYREKADVTIHLPNGLVLKSKEVTDDIYRAIDRAVEKLERQIRKYKDKIRKHKSRSGPKYSVRHNVIAPIVPDEAPAPAGEAGEEEELEVPRVIRTSEFEARPMTVEEAIMALDLQHRSFLVFTNAATGAINVVYRREDGNYGLIETPSQMLEAKK